MELPVGASLHGGTYRIERVLGQGGFGITYLAVHVRLKKEVAVKEFFPKSFCNRDSTTSVVRCATEVNAQMVDKLRDKFLKEAEHIAEMDSPYIVRILDVFEENGTAYYVMDYIKGRSLSEMVKERGPLPEAQAVEYITRIGEALSFVHSRKMNHLDVKPANIMVRDKDNIPVLVDFGLSKHYDSDGNQTSATPVGISHGFAPMEQYKEGGVKEFSPQTDIYSLAATLYYLLTGVVPPQAPSLVDEDFTFPPGVPARLIDPISRAMSTGRKKRQPSVAEFIKEINGAAGVDYAAKTDVAEPLKNARAEAVDNQEDTLLSVPPDTQNGAPGNVIVTSARERNNPDDKLLDFVAGKKSFLSVAPVTQKVAPGNVIVTSARERNNTGNKLLDFVAGKKSFLMVAALVIILMGGVMVYTSLPSKQTQPISTPAKPTPAETMTKEQKVVIDNLLANMVNVKGGTFMMGSEDGYSNEKPIHKETVGSFKIGRYEVTQREWKAVMGNNPSEFKGDDLPVECVSWDDCMEFIDRLNRMTGKKFRLPTEAEWEYAARGGNRSRGYTYSGSDNISNVAWCYKNSGNRTHPVGQKLDKELGLYDMSGNVWEWCSDKYSSSYSSPRDSSNRVRRGGSWSSNAADCRVARRDYDASSDRYNDLGFRLAL